MYKTHETSDLDDALAVLEEAARKKKGELKELIGSKYNHMRNIFSDDSDNENPKFKAMEEIAKVGEKKMREIAEQGEVVARRTIEQVDKKFRENPMLFVGGVAVGALVLGFLVANHHRNGSSE